jgi:hypothetical protein
MRRQNYEMFSNATKEKQNTFYFAAKFSISQQSIIDYQVFIISIPNKSFPKV